MNKLVEQSVQTDRQFEEQEGQTDDQIGGTGQFVGRVLQTDRKLNKQTVGQKKRQTDGTGHFIGGSLQTDRQTFRQMDS